MATKTKKKTARINIAVSSEIHSHLAVVCAKDGRAIKWLVEEAIRHYLKNSCPVPD